MRTFGIATLLCLSACAMGYWPKVESGMDTPKYQNDVRECQTATQSGATQAIGGAVWLALASKSDEGRAKIDDCMTKRGYHIVKVSD